MFRDQDDELDAARRSPAPSLDYGPDIGVALRAIREHQRITMDAVSAATRVRRSYLAAIEDGRVDDLPSTPFSAGYVKAYAQYLGVDADAAVARFKAGLPENDTGLRAPLGVGRERDPRLAIIVSVLVLLLAGFGLWNLVQRIVTDAAPPAAQTAPTALPPAATPTGPIGLGAPLPAPVESTTPELYTTPGLEDSVAAGGSANAVDAAAKARKDAAAKGGAAVATLAIGAPFEARGAIYGAPAGARVIIQARKSGSLVIKGADGSTYFANVLSTGQAYRVPALAGLKVEVSDPALWDVFVDGGFKGHLTSASGPISGVLK